MAVAGEARVRSVGGSFYRADSVFHDVYLSTGELIPELGFASKLQPGDQFDLFGKTWQVERARSPRRRGCPYAVEVTLVDNVALYERRLLR